jgi:hypothetical protein
LSQEGGWRHCHQQEGNIVIMEVNIVTYRRGDKNVHFTSISVIPEKHI